MDCCVCQLLIKASPPCYDQCCREYGTDIIGLLNLKGITTQEVNLGKALEGDTIQKNLLKSLKIELNEEICQNYQKLKNNDEITRFLMELSPLPKEKVTEKIQKMWYNLTYGKIIQRLKRRSKEFDCDISDLFNTGRTYEFKTNDGHIVDSSYEVILDNFLSEKQILHFIPKSFQALSIPFYGDDTRSRPDFVLEDCYIEVAGLTEWELSDYREKMNQKSKMAEQLGIKLVVLTPKKNAGKESYFEISGNYKPGNLIDALANLRY